MPYLFDGYNVYHTACKRSEVWSHLLPLSLCELLAEDMARLGETAVVVFDGVRPRGRAAGVEPAGRVRILYGESRTADDVLVEMIGDNSAPRRLVVVSSDHEIRRAARRRRAVSLSSSDYLEAMVRRESRPKPGPNEPAEKRRGVGEGDLEEWLDLFGLADDEDEDRDIYRMGF